MSGVGITFDETHSFRDWGLRLKKIVIGIPKAKTEYVSVPGMNGDLDLSEAQNGGVKYEMRTLKFTFGARNCSYERWSGLLSQIASDLQGISKRIILDTDKGYYYTGRCEIETEKNNDVTAEIVISRIKSAWILQMSLGSGIRSASSMALSGTPQTSRSAPALAGRRLHWTVGCITKRSELFQMQK